MLNLGGFCSADVGGNCVAKSVPCGQFSASGCTTLALRAQRKLSSCGLHCASRSHYTLSLQFIRLKGRGATKDGLDNPKVTSGSCYAVLVMAAPRTPGACPLPPITAPRGAEPTTALPLCGSPGPGRCFLFLILLLWSTRSAVTHLKSVEALKSKGVVRVFEQRYIIQLSPCQALIVSV